VIDKLNSLNHQKGVSKLLATTYTYLSAIG